MTGAASGIQTPWTYYLTRWFFKLLLKVFYGTIVVENAGYLPKSGEPCIVCANHGNSLTDAMMLVTSFEGFLRVTAKATLFGKPTFTSWIVEKLCCLPIKRRIDQPDSGDVDNHEVMGRLYNALDEGHAVCMFPEGASKYQPALCPLKNGVARIVSEALTRNRNNPHFEIKILTCSITYMNRQHFRSDVLVSFNPPIKLKPQDCPSLLAPASLQSITSLTGLMAKQISAGTLDAPSWDIILSAKVAARIYSPLGTRMTLGDHVRVTQSFMDGLQKRGNRWGSRHDHGIQLTDAVLTAQDNDTASSLKDVVWKDIDVLAQDLKSYHAQLLRLGLKDDRIRVGPLPPLVVLGRIIVRICWLIVLSAVSFPGLILWAPVFASTSYSSAIYARRGAPEDTWDEIAQNKILMGIFSIPSVWIACTVFGFPCGRFTFFVVPCVMWISLRWIEDTVSTFRALTALTRMLWIGRRRMMQLVTMRRGLRSRVMALAVDGLGLPVDPETYFETRGGDEKGRVRGVWDSTARYFSIRRRRKKAWDEILRIWPHEDFY